MIQRIQALKQTKLFKKFFKSEKTSGVILVACTILSLILANSGFGDSYQRLLNTNIGGHSLVDFINDGLMTIFFLLIGLELEREIYIGELSNIRNASLPILGALGGMLIPALLYSLLNFGTITQSGVGIPMATDIAFAIGILSLLGKRVPASLKIFLTALAVIDDLGTVIIVAIFYTDTLSFFNLFIALGIFGSLLILNRLKVHSLIPYLIGGMAMWYFMLHSGVHATVTGVLLAFAIPFGDGNKKSTSYILEKFLNKPVAFVILPLFTIANTCVTIGDGWYNGLVQSSSLGIIIGLVVGKPIGIWFFSFISVKLNICAIPNDLKWKNIFGAALLGGIGFTMSIFITLLAFDNSALVNSSKTAILIGSFASGIIGFIFLKMTLKKQNDQTELSGTD